MSRARKTLIVFLGDYVRSGIGLVTVFFVTRLIGPEQIGMIGYRLGLLGLFSIFLDLGLTTAHIKRVSEKKDLSDCVSTYFFLKAVAIAVYIAIVFFFLLCTQAVELDVIKDGPKSEGIFHILFAYYLFDQMTSIITATFSGREEFVKVNIPTIFGRSVKMIVAILLGYLGWGAIGLAVAYLVDAALSFLIACIFFFKSQIKLKKPSKGMILSYLKYSLPMIVIIPVSVFNSNIDRVMIEKFSTLEQVGFYFAVQNIFVIINSISSSAMTVLLPKISYDFSHHKMDELHQSVYKTARYLSLIIVLASVILLFAAEPIVRICFGPAFIPAANILRVFALVSVVMSVARPYSNVLYGIEGHQKIAIISLLNLVLLLLFNYSLIPKYGALGAALSNLFVWLFSATVQIFLVYRLTELKLSPSLLKHLLAGSFSLCVLNLSGLFRWSGTDFLGSVAVLILQVFIGSFFYFICLWLFGELKKDDWHYLKRSLNIYDFHKDIKDELKRT